MRLKRVAAYVLATVLAWARHAYGGRRRRLDVAVAVAVVFAVVVNGVPAVAAPAVDREVNKGVHGSLPSSPAKICVDGLNSDVCYRWDGDVWWVDDRVANGLSGAVSWENYRTEEPNVLYRRGVCFNALGADGGWAYCDKDYQEGSDLKFWVCDYKPSTGRLYDCRGPYFIEGT